jgi:hypothetical protein
MSSSVLARIRTALGLLWPSGTHGGIAQAAAAAAAGSKAAQAMNVLAQFDSQEAEVARSGGAELAQALEALARAQAAVPAHELRRMSRWALQEGLAASLVASSSGSAGGAAHTSLAADPFGLRMVRHARE